MACEQERAMTTAEKKIANPLNYYANPEELDQDDTLSVEEKIKALESWLNDIQLRETAEAENMLSVHNSSGHFVKQIESLLRKYNS